MSGKKVLKREKKKPRKSTSRGAKARSKNSGGLSQRQSSKNCRRIVRAGRADCVACAGPREEGFAGAELVAALRDQGLRFGEMNIFHYLDEDSGSALYSVANAIEPGTFDWLIYRLRHRVLLFLQLPQKLMG